MRTGRDTSKWTHRKRNDFTLFQHTNMCDRFIAFTANCNKRKHRKGKQNKIICLMRQAHTMQFKKRCNLQVSHYNWIDRNDWCGCHRSQNIVALLLFFHWSPHSKDQKLNCKSRIGAIKKCGVDWQNAHCPNLPLQPIFVRLHHWTPWLESWIVDSIVHNAVWFYLCETHAL